MASDLGDFIEVHELRGRRGAHFRRPVLYAIVAW